MVSHSRRTTRRRASRHVASSHLGFATVDVNMLNDRPLAMGSITPSRSVPTRHYMTLPLRLRAPASA